MNYQEAIAFIHSVEWQGSRPGLERITELLSLLGNPEKEIKAVHVAGTNGKGSFCAMLESVLRHAGYRTGLFVSPYIEHFEERIQYQGQPIDRDELADIVTEIAPHCRTMSDLPTEFEILTAIGFLYFKRKQVDIAVIECGMGGRLDSTNVLAAPLLSVITGISLDHTQFLGDTVEKIAAEKAGIIKPQCPVLYGGKDKEAEAVIAATAAERGSPLTIKDLSSLRRIRTTLKGSVFDYRDLTDITLPLLGTYQPENAAAVMDAVTILAQEGIRIPEEALRKGLASVCWKGRFERLNDDPPVFFDGGHNEEGVRAAVDTVKACFPDEKILIISGVMKDKDYRTIAAELSSVASRVYTVTPDNPRALPAEEYAKIFAETNTEATACSDFETAVRSAYLSAEHEKKPLLCVGSLYAYGSFKAALECEKSKAEKQQSKKRAKFLLLTVTLLFVLLLGLNLLLDSGLLQGLFTTEPSPIEREPVFLYPADYDENIFEDEEYLKKDRTVYYQEGAQGLYLATRQDALNTGELATLFYDYFDAVIHGDHTMLNTFFTAEYFEKNGEKEPFTMQRLYRMEVELINTFYQDQGTPYEIAVYEFDVRYAIDRNNGTFRDDLASDTTRPFIYQVIEDPITGEMKINIISEYNLSS